MSHSRVNICLFTVKIILCNVELKPETRWGCCCFQMSSLHFTINLIWNVLVRLHVSAVLRGLGLVTCQVQQTVFLFYSAPSPQLSCLRAAGTEVEPTSVRAHRDLLNGPVLSSPVLHENTSYSDGAAMDENWKATSPFQTARWFTPNLKAFINRGSQVNPTLLETSVINKENCMYVHSLCLWSGDKFKEKPWMGDLCSERVFCWQGVLSDGLCPHWWSISTLMERSPSTGREGSLTGVMKTMWIIWLGLRRPRATHSDSEQGVCQKSSRWIIKGVTGCCVISAWCGRLFSCTDKERRRGGSGNWAESLYLALCGQWWLLLF